jgi:hypothetical protein
MSGPDQMRQIAETIRNQIERRPERFIPLLLFPLFWFFRSSTYRGDGDQIHRLIDTGTWIWVREPLGQVILQAVYQLLKPWHWNGFLVMNLVSCLSGVIFFFFLIRLFRLRTGTWKVPFLVFLASGFSILFFGHTEYYAMVFAAAAVFFYSVHFYFSRRISLGVVTLAFSLLCYVHLLGLFLAPVLFYLWWAGGRRKEDLAKGIAGLIPLALLYLAIVFQPVPMRFSGEILGDRLLPPFKIQDSGREKLYSFLSLHHLNDMVFWMTKASPLLLPMVIPVFLYRSCRETFLRDRFTVFLWLCSGILLCWTSVWHPDLTIYEDWDLFSIAVFPATWALTEQWVRVGWTRRRPVVAVILIIGILFTGTDIWTAAKLGQRGRGHLRVIFNEKQPDTFIFVDGHSKPEEVYNLLEGQKHLKILSIRSGKVIEGVITIRPGQWTEYRVDWAYSRRSVDRSGGG